MPATRSTHPARSTLHRSRRPPPRSSTAISAGDVDDVDRHAAWLGAVATAPELHPAPRRRGRPVAGGRRPCADPSVAAPPQRRHAGVAAGPGTRAGAPPGLASHLVRAGRRGRQHHVARSDRGRPLIDRLRDVPRLGVPGSTFIFPLMHQVEASGVAEAAVAPVLASPPDAAREPPRAPAGRGVVDARGARRPCSLRLDALPHDAAGRDGARRRRARCPGGRGHRGDLRSRASGPPSANAPSARRRAGHARSPGRRRPALDRRRNAGQGTISTPIS